MLMLVSSAKHDGAKELESAPKNTKRMKKTASSCTISLQGCRIEEVFDFCKEKSMILRHVTGVGYPVYQS